MAPNIKITAIFSSVLVVSMVNALPWVNLCPKVQPMENLDIVKFQGLWYEIMRLPFGEPLMTRCNTENYTVISGSEINITAEFIDLKTGDTLTSIGNATADATTPSVWNYFFPSVWAVGTLDVMETDYENYAVMYSCNTFSVYKVELGWALSRKPTMKQDILNQLLAKFKEQGGNPESLQYVDQSCSSS